ncbi:TonB-dependent hemoglobin/transferrin/lactoferrin family receptor [Vibrio sp. CAU 1672]|uniref:TonB-dependent hemoglobin/transferrin/lactoferrin family receptor n=1 Tax=Vibrio sp. CAU 1672 TaxID=3032594 RepID=UPI0023DCD4AB|nr:TonB-dependent hemoglobin/transferrin/lactoferrin family receptor [Vibrio sp. CAU 1672]MDF2154783.1 TonB-dependent hemoglobin/transferrin/lactoferrin family receptor [Vibrio sp. CAU 1672]
MYKKSILSASILLALAQGAYAQNTTNFDEVVVSATRTEQNASDVSASVASVTGEEIDRTLAKNLYDALQYTAGVEATTSGRFGISGFNIRGMEGDRVKILIDGVQQVTPFNPGGGGVQAIYPSAVELDTLTSIEINKGPSSTLFGSNAMGGAVNLRTKDPEDVLISSGDEVRFGIKSSYYSVDEQFKNTLTWAARRGNFESILIGTYAQGKELKTFGDGADVDGRDRGLENPADKDLNNVLAKAYYRFDENNKLGVVFERYDYTYEEQTRSGNYTLNFGPVPGVTYANTNSHDETTRTRFGLNYLYTNATAAFDKMDLALSLQTTETSNANFATITDHMGYIGYNGDRTRLRQAEDKSVQFDGQFDKLISTSHAVHELTYGFNYVDTDFTLDNVDIYHNTSVSKPGATTIPDAKMNQWGIFAQNNAFLLADRLIVNVGVRYDSFEATPSSDDGFSTQYDKNSNDAITGKLGAVYHLNDKLSTFAQISQGFKAPKVEQLYYEYNTGAEFIPNPDLEAEKSTSYEIGMRGNNHYARFELTGFINKYKDFIDYEDLPSSDPNKERFTIVNRDSVDISGIEFSTTLLLDESFSAPKGLYGKLSVTYLDGKDNSTGRDLDSVAPLSSVIGFGYDSPQGDFGALTSLRLAAKKDKWSDEAQIDSAGYGVVDLTAYYMPMKHLTLTAGLFNALDKKYWTYQDVRGLEGTDNKDFYSQPGRNWGVSLDYQF